MRFEKAHAATIAAIFVLVGCSNDQTADCRNDAPGFLITNVDVIDGSGSPAYPANVRISAGLISDIGDLDACADEIVFDGAGHVLAPGFIDTHSHADSLILEQRDALASVSQGITTVIVGQDGGSEYPLADFFSQIENAPATVNLASYVGHNTIRENVLGEDYRRIATEEEIGMMADMLASELESGALGLATGIEYEPGIYSETSEVLALAHVAANAGGRYISHIRSEDRWFEDALDEIILVGRETGMPVQVSHIKLAMKRLWGSAAETIAKLNNARADGVNITADIYPYEFWQSTMMVLLPQRDYTDRSAIEGVFDQIAPAEGIWMSRYEPKPEYVGKSLPEIAGLLEVDAVDAFTHLAAEAERWEEENGRSAEMIIATSMKDSDIGELMSWPETNICTDGGLNDLHPRGAGSFPRVLGRYARDNQLMSIETAVHKMSGLSAEHMGFTDRGLIKKGMVADLVLFNPDTIIDRATPEQPDALSDGIESVWVNGELVFIDSATTDARPGKVVRRF
ncbi:MAG: N-acyl-D-amino-acid deacylase family protein [Woeseiaceae bacterium]